MPRITYCLSDLHLHDTFTDGCLFTPAKEQVFSALIDKLLAEDGELLFVGDVLDLTGTVPPRNGLEDFFEVAYPGGSAAAAKAGLLPNPRERGVGERIRAIASKFSTFFGRITDLARLGRLTFIPGNHDWEAFTPEGHAALKAELGNFEVVSQPHVWVGDALVSAHGNQFDASCRTAVDFGDPNGWRNQGAVITSVMYHALIPALAALGLPQSFVQAIPAVRPEENIVSGLAELPQFASNRALLTEMLRAFVKLLDKNGYPIPFYANLFSGMITIDRVRNSLRDDSNVDQILAEEASDMVAGVQDPLNLNKKPSIVVMGHTHDIDGAPGYVNLGTWIERVISR